MGCVGVAVQISGLGLQAVAAEWFGRLGDPAEEWLWASVCAVLFVIGAALLMISPILIARAGIASSQLLSVLGPEVARMSESTGRIMAESDGDSRLKAADAGLRELTQRVTKILGTHHDRGRATVYELAPPAPWDRNSQVQLRVVATEGRHDKPRPFTAGTKRGDAALKYVQGGSPVKCHDVKDPAERPDGWDGTASDYRAFFACPIALGEDTYGMLTYDVPEAWSLSDADGEVILMFAAVAGLIQQAAQGASVEAR